MLLHLLLLAVACTSNGDSAQAPDTSPDDTSPDDTAPDCGPDNCDGCCQPDGACADGAADDACGTGGEACGDCAAVEDHCDLDHLWCTNSARTNGGLVDDSSLHVQGASDVERLRTDLVRYIWGSAGLPGRLPDASTEGVSSPVAGLTGVARVDQFRVELPGGFTSWIYRFVPEDPDGRVVFFQQGHSYGLDENGGGTTLQFFLDRGITAYAAWMPGFGENTGPTSDHGQIMALQGLGVSPLAIFLEPVVVALNQAEADGARDLTMIGISGGGWTTTWIAALDPRIGWSFPTAGSLPLYLRGPNDVGDAEQYWEEAYALAGYLDLYALGSVRDDGGQDQMLNRYDACCFEGLDYQGYEPGLAAAIPSLGTGSFRVFLDESHTSHLISSHALATDVAHRLANDGVRIVDDIDPPYGAYDASGSWTAWRDQGFGSTVQSAPAGDGSSTATWTFAVEPGTWTVAATWTPLGNRASNAPFTITGTETQTERVDQRSAPADFDDSGTSWCVLSDVLSVDGTTLTVTLSNDADGQVIADAIRVAPVE
jgi:hypothetical protein